MSHLDVNQPKMNMPYMEPNHPMVKRQNPQTVKGSGISLDHQVRMEMAYQLDRHNCALNVALHQYQQAPLADRRTGILSLPASLVG